MKEEEEEEEVVEVKKTEREITPVATSVTATEASEFTAVGKGGKTVEVDERPVLLRLREVLESRGKKVNNT